MNERIVDIAVEANDQTGNEFDLNYKPLDAFLAKFAELIVQECVNVLHDNELWNRHISHALNEHFGVE
jgi:hypothetical protein